MNNIIFIILFSLLTYTCKGQETKLPNSIEDFNIPNIRYSEGIKLAKQLIDKNLIKIQKRDSLTWQKVEVRLTTKEEVAFAPFRFLRYYDETIPYWDTTFSEKTIKWLHIVENLHQMAYDNQIQCFSYDGNKKYNKHELSAILKSSPDTLSKGTPYEFINYNTLYLGQFEKMIIVEEWLQKKSGALESKILAIGPILHKHDDRGNYTGAILLCWYILD